MVDNTKINEIKFCHSGESLAVATDTGFKIFEVKQF